MSFHAQSDRSTIFQPAFVATLFDEMAATYGLVNVLSSFGFCVLWRKQCVRHISSWTNAPAVADWMSGMGELWPDLCRRCEAGAAVTAVDISPVMCERAQKTQSRSARAVKIVQADVLSDRLPDASADVVVSSFGLKTFSPEQQTQLAKTLSRVLRPGGRFAFLEISVPKSPLLRWPYLFYLRHIIPTVGRLMLGTRIAIACSASTRGVRQRRPLCDGMRGGGAGDAVSAALLRLCVGGEWREAGVNPLSRSIAVNRRGIRSGEPFLRCSQATSE